MNSIFLAVVFLAVLGVTLSQDPAAAPPAIIPQSESELRIREYPCGERKCPDDYEPVCAYRYGYDTRDKEKSMGTEKKKIYKTLPNKCKMYAQNDCGAEWKIAHKGKCHKC